MHFNSKLIALAIGLVITFITYMVDLLIGHVGRSHVLVLYLILCISVVIIVYVALEFLIFREINKIYLILDKIKVNENKQKLLKDFKTKNLPIKRKKIFDEVYSYVSKKQAEINELKKLETFRREFLADISHELKTPIFSAQGFIHTLIDGAIDDKANRMKFLQKAAKSLDGLQELVEDLLVLSQLETGELQMKKEMFDIVELTRDLFEMFEEKAKKRDIHFKVLSEVHKKLMVFGDPFRISIVMKNLIENAVKYGSEGGKIIVGFDIDKENVIISVKDDGPGIPPEHLRRIFERFYRVDKSRSKEKGGSGLGLAIVKQIVEAHDSKVMVTSKVDKGTTFAFILKNRPQHA